MRFSVICPSRMIPYATSAKFPEQKLVRAIQSVLDQTFKDFELIVVADGCEKTKEIVTTNFTDERLVLLECKHEAIFSNLPRNTGIKTARGEYIIYIDADDYWGTEHLAIIDRNLKGYEWVWFNDIVFSNDAWCERACNIKILGGCGTSTICHSRRLNVKWEKPGYTHDYYFIQKLLTFRKNTKIETPEYYVCHAPGGWDL
jgi:glycosyltransferase involved in cell wall biosynthesis